MVNDSVKIFVSAIIIWAAMCSLLLSIMPASQGLKEPFKITSTSSC